MGTSAYFCKSLSTDSRSLSRLKAAITNPAPKQPDESRRPARPEKVDGLGQDGFAGAPWWSVPRRLRHRPLARTESRRLSKATKIASVNEDAFGHSPWLSSIASFVALRSAGKPSTEPIRSAMESSGVD